MSKRSLSDTIVHSARFLGWLRNIIRHLKNYQEFRAFVEEEYPDVYEAWLDEISREPVTVGS